MSLQRLNQKHHRMVELYLGGDSRSAIAGKLDCTPESVGMVCNSPLFQQEIARRRSVMESKADEAHALEVSDGRELLASKAKDAAQLHCDFVDDFDLDPRVRQASAEAILNRVYGKDSGSGTPAVLINVEQLNLLQTALAESR